MSPVWRICIPVAAVMSLFACASQTKSPDSSPAQDSPGLQQEFVVTPELYNRTGAFAVEPEVMIDNTLSNRYTVIQVSGLDRPGLLYDLTAVLSKLNLNIGSAHIVTFGEKAVDSFYITDLTGAKISSAPRQAAIRRHLLATFESR